MLCNTWLWYFLKFQQHKQHGDEPDLGEGWVAIESVPEDAVVKESNERKITTHDEVEDILETEEVKHLGDVTSQVSS